MISNCGHNELGGYTGGVAGDQTGTEWQIIPWYRYRNGGWNCVLRYPDPAVRAKIAELARAGASNDNIGYCMDLTHRTEFWAALKVAGYDPAKITKPVEADCSSSTDGIVKAVGYLLGNAQLKNINAFIGTGLIKKHYTDAGFVALTDRKYLTSADCLLAGDILLNELHHVCINVDDGRLASQEATMPAIQIKQVPQYAGKVTASDYLQVRDAPKGNEVKLGGQSWRLAPGMIVSFDAESNGWGRITGTNGWCSLSYIRK